MTSTKDLHAFIQKDMDYVNDLMDEGETIKDAVKKGAKKEKKKSPQKSSIMDDDDLQDNDDFVSEEINDLSDESLDSTKVDTQNSHNGKNSHSSQNNQKAKPTLRNAQKAKNTKNSTSTNEGFKKSNQTNNKDIDITNEELFTEEPSADVIEDAFEEGGTTEPNDIKKNMDELDIKLSDQGANENTFYLFLFYFLSVDPRALLFYNSRNTFLHTTANQVNAFESSVTGATILFCFLLFYHSYSFIIFFFILFFLFQHYKKLFPCSQKISDC
ncbi:rhoptry-associated membrane antigen, putative [Plasmodium malariae]|uniref:Rhoptry-associated membrane antigen, putative n=1 Tax=Plasmodium malariae TaxID=5858 RepID=A0A1C3KL43_PLAMA|nr:rhoptry-associated membrane antigen, putative [Plasmodium malariae]